MDCIETGVSDATTAGERVCPVWQQQTERRGALMEWLIASGLVNGCHQQHHQRRGLVKRIEAVKPNSTSRQPRSAIANRPSRKGHRQQRRCRSSTRSRLTGGSTAPCSLPVGCVCAFNPPSGGSTRNLRWPTTHCRADSLPRANC